MAKDGHRTRRTTAIAAVLLASALLATLGAGPAAARRGAAPETIPTPRADWRFEGTLASSIAGAPNLRNINANGSNFFVGDGPPLFGTLAFPEGNGLRLDNVSSVVPRDNYTVAMTIGLDDVAPFTRLLNFKPNTAANADTGLYVQDADITFFGLAGAQPDNDLLQAQGVAATVVLTRSSSGRLKGYVNGALQFNVLDTTGLAKISTENVLRFFRDNANREEGAGYVARIRLWNTPLTGAQVATLPV